MEQLYMFEIMLEKIRLAPSVFEVPQLQELKFGIVFTHLINLNLYLDDIPDSKTDQDPFEKNINLNLGKSIMFSCKPADLHSIINRYPLDIHLKTITKIGSVSKRWSINFIEMIDKSSLAPAIVRNTYELLDESQIIKAVDLDLSIRLSSHGQNNQTKFQMVPRNRTFDEDRVGHVFKDVKGLTVFRAQTFNGDPDLSGMVNIAALGEPANSKTFLQKDGLKPEEFSIDEFHKILCGNINHPGASEYSEFGMGPTADGGNFPLSCGLSNTYGVMQNCGHFGLYLKPKAFGDEENQSTNDCECAPELSIVTTKSNDCECSPIRLRGGGSENDENGTPQPMVMCKDLMQSFDKVLEEYKKALGPCGQSVCPFSYNILDETCKKFCKGNDMTALNMLVADIPTTDPNLLSACGTRTCPFTRTQSVTADKSFQQNQLKSACGKPTCPFTKQKLGTATDEEILEMQFVEKNCQPCSSKRPHSSLTTQSLSVKPLEPIHWDCPDLLPKGPCRNPQCPFKPKELRYTPKGPRGSTECSYVTFPACAELNCPFSTPPIPSNPPCQIPSCPPNVIYCSNVGCPANPPTCGNPKCPTKPCSIILPCQPPCQLPPCQLPPCQQPPCQLPPCQLPPCQPTSSICSNSNCPFGPANKGANPSCSFKKLSITTCPDDAGDTGSICKNPQCIYAKKNSMDTKDSYCSNKYCPNRPQARKNSICSNPQCPYEKVEEKGSICSNPNCPFQKPKPGDKESVCSNTSCPYRKAEENGSLCSNPDCQFRKTDENASICANPDCPYQKTKGIESICSNPDCPYGKPQQNDSICCNPECPYQTAQENGSICFNPDCPFRKPEDNISGSICLNPDCPIRRAEQNAAICLNPNVCSNPDCPFQQSSGDSIVLCTNPYCPHALQTQDVDDQNGYNCPCCSFTSASMSEQFPKVPPNVQDQSALTTEKQEKKWKRRSSGFMYKIGDLYPGVHIGHRRCVIPGQNVPAKMGWAWNVDVPCIGLKPRRGWRPGVIPRTVAKTIMAHRRAKGLEPMDLLTSKPKKCQMGEDDDSDVTVEPKPTLLVKKKDGAYVITMHPLKDPYKIEDNENPYMNCSPLQFKILKKEKCKDEARLCFCDEPEESSSDSELDIEFTPPAGIIRPDRLKRKKNVVHTDTQYSMADISPAKSATPGEGKKRKAAKGGQGKKKGKK